jgi:hypothetical protein
MRPGSATDLEGGRQPAAAMSDASASRRGVGTQPGKLAILTRTGDGEELVRRYGRGVELVGNSSCRAPAIAAAAECGAGMRSPPVTP